MKSTFDHGFAYQLDAYPGVREQKSIQELFNSSTSAELMEKLSLYAADDGQGYRHKDPGEFIAEAWSEYCNNNQERWLKHLERRSKNYGERKNSH